jgi:hypothetical protein
VWKLPCRLPSFGFCQYRKENTNTEITTVQSLVAEAQRRGFRIHGGFHPRTLIPMIEARLQQHNAEKSAAKPSHHPRSDSEFASLKWKIEKILAKNPGNADVTLHQQDASVPHPLTTRRSPVPHPSNHASDASPNPSSNAPDHAVTRSHDAEPSTFFACASYSCKISVVLHL